MSSQQTDILHHMQKYPITQMIATHRFSCLRLSERIRELEWRGFTINRTTAEMTNRHGNTARYTVYSLPKTAKNQKLFKAVCWSKV